jgi:hypothetical protein
LGMPRNQVLFTGTCRFCHLTGRQRSRFLLREAHSPSRAFTH